MAPAKKNAASQLSSKAGPVKKNRKNEAKCVNKIEDVEARLNIGQKVALWTGKLKVLCAALALQRSEPRWRSVLIGVSKASKIYVIEVAIAGGIPKTRTSCQSANLDVLQRAAELLDKDRIMCKTGDLEVLAVAVALLGEARVRGVSTKPEVLKKAAEVLGTDRVTDISTDTASRRVVRVYTAAAAQKALAVTRTVNGTGHTGPSRFCATSP
jgi:hypothetical protein